MRPGWRRIGAVALAVIVVVAALNVAGLLRYPGGPLRDRSDDGPLWLDLRASDQGTNAVGFMPGADWATVGRTIYFGQLTLRNPWPWAATIEAITPIDPSPGLTVEGTYVSLPGVPAAMVALGPEAPVTPGMTFDQAFGSLPAVVDPTGPNADDDALALLVLRADRPGPMTFSGLALDYRVGPATFHAVQYLALDGCIGPLPLGVTCPSQ